MQNSQLINRFCVRCRAILNHNQTFCSFCGTQQPQTNAANSQPARNGLSATSIVAIVASCVLFVSCGLCGIIGAISDRNADNQQASTTNESPSFSPSPLPSASPKSKAVIVIPKLIGQSPQTIERILSKPITIIPITRDSPNERRTPGEYRNYKLDGLTKGVSTENGVMIRFYKGKAVMIMVDLPSSTATAQDALLLGGIDVQGKPPTVTAALAERWQNFTFNGIRYKDVNAEKVVSSSYNVIQAEIEP